ncbi:hypothetical protein GCM10009677_13250 [Sphaerisporangium rubeum]|uniref:Uncharacterized protein n=1 Tax=Sphaerisporangium rubeum TaxID=321317 RepID=A0A7X0IDJ8_9ACTN|nr:hypothetical protein [Sphaerisporangium rubeum]MBB6473035.1 hypothetical protein [Sphaerisporangium rubeum]
MKPVSISVNPLRGIRRFRRSLTVIAVMAMMTIGFIGPASAQTVTCNVGTYSCNTDIIPANGSGHWVKWSVENAAWDDSNYAVYDADNGAIVGQGYIGTGNSRSGRIDGLYGRYYLKVYNSSWDTIGILWNS